MTSADVRRVLLVSQCDLFSHEIQYSFSLILAWDTSDLENKSEAISWRLIVMFERRFLLSLKLYHDTHINDLSYNLKGANTLCRRLQSDPETLTSRLWMSFSAHSACFALFKVATLSLDPFYVDVVQYNSWTVENWVGIKKQKEWNDGVTQWKL